MSRNITKSKPKAILIDVIDPEMTNEEALRRLEELEMLVTTYGGIVVVKTIQKRGLPDYKTFIGSGKVNEILCIGEEKEANLLIVNNIAKPMQIYNLNEKFRKIEMEVWDRIDLILNIFDKHAGSTEAKLQIELARIRHMGPRIVGMGTELMQQTGAIGLRGGAGETNIEIMKRHLRKQEQRIKEKLTHYDKINEGHRLRRKRKNLKTAALIGYTNAGKSSVLNALTGKGAYVADELFATLDTRVGKLYIKNDLNTDPRGSQNPWGHYKPGTEILISDTIGFIQDLPPSLIKAFKSTLAETIDADLLLHVIDISDPMIEMKIEVVEDILDQLGLSDKPKIYVFNKIDLIHMPKRSFSKQISSHSSSARILPGVLKAGPEAAEELGWENDDAKKQAAHDPIKLKKRFKKFSPVFISAYKEKNLQELIEKIKEKLG